MNIIELAKQAGFGIDESPCVLQPYVIQPLHGKIDDELSRFAALVRAEVLEEAAKKRAKPPRRLPKRGTGALWDEQQHCYELGYREGTAAVRAAIRALKETL
jgi:hypothetical protein